MHFKAQRSVSFEFLHSQRKTPLVHNKAGEYADLDKVYTCESIIVYFIINSNFYTLENDIMNKLI